MLSITGMNKFYYIKNFTDMRCKYNRILAVIRHQLGREPEQGDVFIVMSKNRRLIRLFAYDRISCQLFEKRFVPEYEFMKVEYDGEQPGNRMDGKDMVTHLESPVRETLRLRSKMSSCQFVLFL